MKERRGGTRREGSEGEKLEGNGNRRRRMGRV